MNTKLRVKTVYGPPGTGKTQYLSNVAAQCVKDDVPTLILSFTRAAAQEIAGRTEGDRVRASTLHALAYARLGLNSNSVVNAKRLRDFGQTVGIPFKGVGDDEELQVGDDYKSVIDFAANRMIDRMEAYDLMGAPGDRPMFVMFCKSYNEWKHEFGLLDFNDMLEKAAAHKFHGRKVVMLDEAQDCSPLQWSLFRKIIEDVDKVYIAGDDDQAIFEWSGADPHGMDRFTNDHGNDVVILDQSHRVPRIAFDLAHDKALARIKTRVPKKFKPMKKEGSLTEYADVSYYDFFKLKGTNSRIIVRDNFRLKEVQRLLHEAEVPYRIGGRASPYENRIASCVRGHSRDGLPTDEELKDMRYLSIGSVTDKLLKERDWAKMRQHKWYDLFRVPGHLIDFYSKIDLFAPLTVTLSTVHQAKGTEADTVVVDLTWSPMVENGFMRNQDAEARVLYVALTRTKDELVLCGSNLLI